MIDEDYRQLEAENCIIHKVKDQIGSFEPVVPRAIVNPYDLFSRLWQFTNSKHKPLPLFLKHLYAEKY